MLVKDLMRTDVVCFKEADPLANVLDTLVERRLHVAPVVDDDGRLTGVISQQDVFFSGMTHGASGSGQATAVRDVMTSPPVYASEDSTVVDLCRMMFTMRIHRVPIVDQGKVTGIVSSLDVCAAIASGKALG